MKKLFVISIFLSFFAFASSANAVITQLTNESQMTTVFLNDFETAKDIAPVTFDTTAELRTAAVMTDNVTPSGVRGLFDFFPNEPLVALLGVGSTAVGMYFGNDDFNLFFDAVLSVWNDATFLGSVSVTSNANDWADQFIGLSSTDVFNRVEIFYTRPQAAGLGVYIDDFRIGPIPEPEIYAMMLAGLGLMGFVARRRRQHADS